MKKQLATMVLQCSLPFYYENIMHAGFVLIELELPTKYYSPETY